MTRGRRPLPIEIKRRRGTLRPGRLPPGAPLHVVAPLEVSNMGRDFSLGTSSPAEAFDRVLREGVPWLAVTDFPAVALCREGFELLDRAKAAGSTRDQVLVMRHLASLLSQLGFDPISRSRLGLAEVKARSKLDVLRARSID